MISHGLATDPQYAHQRTVRTPAATATHPPITSAAAHRSLTES